VNTEGIDTVAAILRRSLWIVLLLLVVGAVMFDLVRHSQGKQYVAKAGVILAPADLSQLYSGSSQYVDPTLVDQTEKALAQSPQLFDQAAKANGGALGGAGALEKATHVSKTGTTIAFTATGSSPHRVVAIANAVANAYPAWRTNVASTAIQNAITQIQDQLRGSGSSRPDLVSQLNRLKVLRTLTSGNVLLVEPATDATKTRPRLLRDSVIGGLIGLFVALLVIAVREALDTRVRSEQEVEELLDVPVLGTVEALPRGTQLATSQKGRERFGDMYGLLAANVAHDTDGDRAVVIAVTSATAREGKTTTASNLATALALRNARVVLVDLDTRKPAVDKVFRLPPETKGLEQVFYRKISPDALTWTVPQNGTGANAVPTRSLGSVDASGNGHAHTGSLRVLPLKGSVRGGIPAHHERIQQMLESLAHEADYIVIDTAPALSVPDMTELSQLVDVVVLVVRHGRVTRRNLAALSRLSRTWNGIRKNAVLVGVPRQESYSYYGE
jgi:Mrp family chromosome partitioning ATPase